MPDHRYVPQSLLEHLTEYVSAGKVVIIYGPRQVGKTTLLNRFLADQDKVLFVSGEDIAVQRRLSSQSIEQLKSFVGDHALLAIDEAQQVPHIGLNLKLLVDHCPHLKIIVTGSSSFDLANQVGEPLTGRKSTLRVFPLSQIEMNQVENAVQTEARLEERLLYGSYPEVILMQDNFRREEYLRELVSSYLYKDILEIEGVRKSKSITQILQLLAFQIGKAVSISEVAQQVGLNSKTVARYIDLLEKAFVLVRVGGFSRNLRKEVSKSDRYYFYDVGVRNALINQFNSINVRNDVGELWENYLVMERLKKQAYQREPANNYYWRTYHHQEIDWVEERNGELHGYEIKWKETQVKVPTDWRKAYPDASFTVVNRDNYLKFIGA